MTTAPTSGLSPSLIRTFIPFIVGLLGSWLTRQGLDIDDDLLSALLVSVFGFGYYVVVRFLEVFASGKWGYILGVATGPVYSPALQDDAHVADEVGAGELRLIGVIVAGILLALLLWSLLA